MSVISAVLARFAPDSVTFIEHIIPHIPERVIIEIFIAFALNLLQNVVFFENLVLINFKAAHLLKLFTVLPSKFSHDSKLIVLDS